MGASPRQGRRSQSLGTAGVAEIWRCGPHPPIPAPPQIVGSRLRIPQVTPADTGEYVCHVSNGAGSQETSLIVTIQGSGSSHGESAEGGGFRKWVQGEAQRSLAPASLSDIQPSLPQCPVSPHQSGSSPHPPQRLKGRPWI